MSSKEGYGRSSLSFNAPKGILDVDDIMGSSPWKGMKAFDHEEAGQIQQVLTEFGDMLSQQKQKKESDGAVKKKNEPKKKVVAKMKEPAKMKGNTSGMERRSGKVVADNSYQKIGKVEGKPKQLEAKRTSMARKTKSTPKKNEDYGGVPIKKPRKDLENVGNEEKPVAEKKVVTRRSLMNVGISATKVKKTDGVQTGDGQGKPKGNVENATKKKSKIDDTDVKKTIKRPRKATEKTVTEKTSMKNESKDTKHQPGSAKSTGRTGAEVDKENKKPSMKKLETNLASRSKKIGVGNRKTTQCDKPLSASRSSFGKNRVLPKKLSSSTRMEECGEGTAEKSTEVKSNGLENDDSLEKSLEKLRQSIEPTAGQANENVNVSAIKQENSAESFYSMAEATRVIGEETPKGSSATKDTKIKTEMEVLSSTRIAAGLDNSATASQLQLSKSASSTMLYDSAISSCSHKNRKSQISIVARVQSDLDESLPPLELKCKVDMMKCKKGGKLRPKITMKTPRNKVGELKDAFRNMQSKPQEKKPEMARKQCSKGKPRKSYQQRLEDREERRELRRARRHKRKAALAIEEFSRHVVKMAKKIGYLNGDSGSASASSSSTATTSSTSSSSFDSRDGRPGIFSESSDDSSSTYTSIFSSSDSSYCSCTTCLFSDSYESSGDFTEFSPCSSTSDSSGSSCSSTTDDSESD